MKILMYQLVIFCIAIGSFVACTEQKSIPVEPEDAMIGGPGNHIEFLANHFFDVYAKREDWEGFLSLYHDSIDFQDVLLQNNYKGKQAFKDFYNWPDSGFAKHPDYPNTLVLEALATTDSSAVGKGYFTPFYYQGELFDQGKKMEFNIWLYFDKSGKITKQIDFIVYPPIHLKSIAEGLLKDG